MMDQWSNRYARGQGAARQMDHARFDRIRNILLILLTVALVGMTIAGTRAIIFRNSCGSRFVNTMRTEINAALTDANTLSRNGGSESAALLGRIRASVHAADVINENHNSLYGRYLINPGAFAEVYSIVDSYFHKLKNGTVIIDEQTNLVSALTNLQTMVNALQ